MSKETLKRESSLRIDTGKSLGYIVKRGVGEYRTMYVILYLFIRNGEKLFLKTFYRVSFQNRKAEKSMMNSMNLSFQLQ